MEVVMHRARAFFYVCAGVFLSYHLGAQRAEAQAGTKGFSAFAASGTYLFLLTPNGDVYARVLDPRMPDQPGQDIRFELGPRSLVGNFWSGGQAPAKR